MRTILLPLMGILLGLSWISAEAQMSSTLPANPALSNVSKAEYFFDTDPGMGSGTSISITAGLTATGSYTVPISSLSNGLHRFYLRVANAAGAWSLTTEQPLFLVTPLSFPANPSLANVTGAEYFFDTDPGFGRGSAIPVTAGLTTTVSNYAIPITSLSNGIHRLYLRTMNAGGVWSLCTGQPLFIVPPISVSANPPLVNVVAAEGFFDTDPGFGKGVPIAVATPGTNTVINAVVSLSGLSNGVHKFYQRVKDAGGRWSLTNVQNLAVLAPSLIIPANPAPGNLTRMEYFFDTDPGFGKGTAVAIPATTNLANFTFAVDVSALTDGTHYLYVRVLDDWSLSTVVTLSTGVPLAVTLLSFTGRLQQDNTVLLNWQTTNEVNNSYFEVQRSGDGANFSPIGDVPGGGTTTLQRNYAYTDGHPLEGVNYYRLREVALDSTVTYSPIVSVQVTTGQSFVIQPNPVKDMLTVRLGGTLSGGGMFRILDMQGHILQLVTATQASTQQVIVSGLAAGTYILQYVSTTGVHTTTFIKI